MSSRDSRVIRDEKSQPIELLLEASSRLVGSLHLPDVLSSIVELAARVIPVDAYSIWRRGESGVWSPVISKGLSEAYMREAAPSGPEDLEPEPIILHDLGADPILAARQPLYAAEGIRALVAMPLSIHKRRAGTLVFYSRTPHVFDKAELKLASAIANLAGAAITSAELYEEQGLMAREKERAQQRTMFLAQASQILASSLDYETTLSAVAHLAIGYMADWCTVDIASNDGGPPRRLAIAHIDPMRISWAQELRRRYPPDENDSTARVIRTGEPVLATTIEDWQLVGACRDEEHLRLIRELGPTSFLCVPMIARGKILGALSFLTCHSDRRYTEADLVFAQDLANRCGLAIDNAALYAVAKENAERERESRAEVETLNRVSQLISAELNRERLAQAVSDAGTELTRAECGSFHYTALHHKGDSYAVYSTAPPHRSGPQPEDCPPASPETNAFESRPVRVADLASGGRARASEAARMLHSPVGVIRSYLDVPVSARSGEVIGHLYFGHSTPDVFTGRDERIMAGLARQTAIAMENAQLMEFVQSARADVSEAHEQLRNILESTSDAFLGMDGEWRITHLNERAAAMAGRSRGELLGHDVRSLFAGIAESRAFKKLQEAAERREPVQFEEHLAATKLWLEISAYPTRLGLAVFGRDITEKKRFEEQMRETAKLESLGIPAGGVAHDFNNILCGVLGNASLALESISPSSPVVETIRDVITATEKAANLTRQLLAYAGKGRFIIRLLDISDLIREMAALLQTSIPRSVQLRVNLAERLPCVEGDAAQIQQLLMNLIINAAEAISEGTGGAVTVTTGVQDVDEHYLRTILSASEMRPGQYVTIEVSDNGCGMDAETMKRIFDPFFTTKFTGRGLGLAAALGIVRGHHGALKVYSTPGMGSTFKVLFPASDAVPDKEPATLKTASPGTGLILVVDDEEIVRRTAKKTLERYGYDVITADDGSEAVKLFEALATRVSLVLLDLTMPVMGGEETLRRLKAIRPGVRVVLSSGFNEAEAIQRFAGKGLTGFIQKPYTAGALAESITAALADPVAPVV